MDWEIWLAHVAFEEDPSQSKLRPVMIMPNGGGVTVLKVTSQTPRDDRDYQLSKWSQAGLDKPSVIRMDKKILLQQSDFVRRLGRLHSVDILQVKNTILRQGF